jgi:hypothetical protein
MSMSWRIGCGCGRIEHPKRSRQFRERNLGVVVSMMREVVGSLEPCMSLCLWKKEASEGAALGLV